MKLQKSSCHMPHQHLGNLISAFSSSQGAESRELGVQVTRWGQLCKSADSRPHSHRQLHPFPPRTACTPWESERPEFESFCHCCVTLAKCFNRVGLSFPNLSDRHSRPAQSAHRVGVTITQDNALCKQEKRNLTTNAASPARSIAGYGLQTCFVRSSQQ